MASWLQRTVISLKNNAKHGNEKGFGSTRLFALKESRWFTREEYKLFQNVFESGYILELRLTSGQDGGSINKDTSTTIEYGIVLWTKKAGESREAILVHLTDAFSRSKGRLQSVMYTSLEKFWQNGMEIRINNIADGRQKADIPEKINKRINRAIEGSYKWRDSLRFVHWCRYGNPPPTEENHRKRNLSDAAVRWGSVSASAGALLYVTKCQQRRSERRA